MQLLLISKNHFKQQNILTCINISWDAIIRMLFLFLSPSYITMNLLMLSNLCSSQRMCFRVPMKGFGALGSAWAWRRLNKRTWRNISTFWLLVVPHHLQNVSIIMQGEGWTIKWNRVVWDSLPWTILNSLHNKANYLYLLKSKCTNCMSSEISISTVAWGVV